MRFDLLDTPAGFSFPFPFAALFFPAVVLDDPPFAVPRVFVCVRVFDVNLERFWVMSSVSCGLRDRLWEVDGPRSCEATRRVIGLGRELDASELSVPAVELVVGGGPGFPPWPVTPLF